MRIYTQPSKSQKQMKFAYRNPRNRICLRTAQPTFLRLWQTFTSSTSTLIKSSTSNVLFLLLAKSPFTIEGKINVESTRNPWRLKASACMICLLQKIKVHFSRCITKPNEPCSTSANNNSWFTLNQLSHSFLNKEAWEPNVRSKIYLPAISFKNGQARDRMSMLTALERFPLSWTLWRELHELKCGRRQFQITCE